MKKIMIVPVALMFAGASLNAQDNSVSIAKANTDKKEARAEKKEAKKELRRLNGDDVSVMAKDHLYQDFGKVDANWRRTSYFDEASFMQDGKALTAYYDGDAELVGTTSPADFNAIPASAQTAIKKRYKDYTIGKVILFDDNEANASDMVLYGSPVSDEDNYFVELTKGQKTIVLEVNMEGAVSYFTQKK